MDKNDIIIPRSDSFIEALDNIKAKFDDFQILSVTQLHKGISYSLISFPEIENKELLHFVCNNKQFEFSVVGDEITRTLSVFWDFTTHYKALLKVGG